MLSILIVKQPIRDKLQPLQLCCSAPPLPSSFAPLSPFLLLCLLPTNTINSRCFLLVFGCSVVSVSSAVYSPTLWGSQADCLCVALEVKYPWCLWRIQLREMLSGCAVMQWGVAGVETQDILALKDLCLWMGGVLCWWGRCPLSPAASLTETLNRVKKLFLRFLFTHYHKVTSLILDWQLLRSDVTTVVVVVTQYMLSLLLKLKAIQSLEECIPPTAFQIRVLDKDNLVLKNDHFVFVLVKQNKCGVQFQAGAGIKPYEQILSPYTQIQTLSTSL